MAILNKIFGEFVDVIEWTDDTSNTMVYRFERYGNEIKYGAKMTVRESQAAVLINEGQLADVFTPGMYELSLANVPILSTLQSWKHGFQSPFKAEVYFFNMRRFTDLKWGTKNAIMLRDPEFGPVRLRAFGSYVMRVTDPAVFLKEIVGTDGQFTTEEITDQIRNEIVSRFAKVLSESGVPVLDLAASYDKLGDFLTERLKPEMAETGLELVKLLVENVSLPPEVEAALDKRTQMGIVGDLDRYMKFQTAEAMTKAAEQEGGGAGAGIGLGVGMAMAQQAARSLEQSAPAVAAAPVQPPALPTERQFWIAVGGKQTGPYAMSQLGSRIGGGEVAADQLVWAEGMAAWAGAGTVAELKPYFAMMPPPLPGAS